MKTKSINLLTRKNTKIIGHILFAICVIFKIK